MNHWQTMKKLRSKTWFIYWTGNTVCIYYLTQNHIYNIKFPQWNKLFVFCQVLYLSRGLSWNVPSSWWEGSFQIIHSWRVPGIPRQFVGHSEVTRSGVVFQTTIEAATSETWKLFSVIHKLFQAMRLLAKEDHKGFQYLSFITKNFTAFIKSRL